jgi:isoquinoline 1-oxidoreductase beta subunit
MKNDFYRPATLQKVEAGIDSQGKLTAWSQKVVAPSIAKIVNPGMIKDGIDQYLVWGINDTAYSFPNFHVEVVTLDSPIPPGVWRSVQNGPNAFVIESFLDELAHAAGRDPLEFRLELLKNNVRPRRVLETVAEKAGWGKPMPKGQGRGIAHHSCFGSHIAHAAEISVNETTGKISVHRIVAAIDCGQVVNPGPLKAQIEGGIILALSSSLKEKVIFADGGVKSANYDDYEIMRISEVPEIEVYILKSQEKPGGVGELGVPPTAPAVGNAFFNATGVRLRRLPMNPASVLEALKKKGA